MGCKSSKVVDVATPTPKPIASVEPPAVKNADSVELSHTADILNDDIVFVEPQISSINELDNGFPDVKLTEEDFPLPSEAEDVELSKGVLYRGEWLNGKQQGFGQMTFPDGGRYVGEFKSGKAEGQGVFFGANGSTYCGEFVDSRAHGYGKFVFKDGSTYWGNFEQDKRVGVGKEILNDGTVYVGEFARGTKEGIGILVSNNEQYIGEFKEGDLSGVGQYQWPDGRVYQGEWILSKQNGMAFFTWPQPNERHFAGRYREGKIAGFGSLWWADGRLYRGLWSNGLQNGNATYYLSKEVRRDANFLEGVRTKWLGEEEAVAATDYPIVPDCELFAVKIHKNSIAEIRRHVENLKASLASIPTNNLKA